MKLRKAKEIAVPEIAVPEIAVPEIAVPEIAVPVEWVNVSPRGAAGEDFAQAPRVRRMAGKHSSACESAGNGWGRQGWWASLPSANQGLLVLLIGGTTMAVIATVGPVAANAIQSAAFPYTAEGKRQTCQSNIKALYQAASMYAQDFDGQFPVLERVVGRTVGRAADKAGAKGRQTWVSAFGSYTHSPSASVFQCPNDRVPRDVGRDPVASYVMNPVVAGRGLDGVDDFARTALFVDGGEKHDLSLLPPMPSWPNSSADASGANVALRHYDSVGASVAQAVFADGHVESINATNSAPESGGGGGSAHGNSLGSPGGSSLAVGDVTSTHSFWGGSALIRAALDRIAAENRSSQKLTDLLLKGEIAPAARLIRSDGKVLKPTVGKLSSLALFNGGSADVKLPGGVSQAIGELKQSSDKVERLGWTLSQAISRLGDKSLEAALQRKVRVRSADELRLSNGPKLVFQNQAGTGIELPAHWTMQESDRGRYHVATLRPVMADVTVVCEIGSFQTYRQSTPIDWRGTEKALKRKYGSAYRRIEINRAAFLSGISANRWEYELRKPDGPPLRKICVGHRTAWSSHVVICTVPKQEFPKWKPAFERAIASFGES